MPVPVDVARAKRSRKPISAHSTGDLNVGRYDVTRLAKKLAQTPSATHTVVVGSLVGSREGVFTMKTGVLPAGALAQIRFYFEEVEGPTN